MDSVVSLLFYYDFLFADGCVMMNLKMNKAKHNHSSLQIPVRSRGWAIRNKKFSSSTGSTIVGNSSFYMSNTEERKPRPLSSHGLTTEAIGTHPFCLFKALVML